jgi:uncharacterized membrane protein YfcA
MTDRPVVRGHLLPALPLLAGASIPPLAWPAAALVGLSLGLLGSGGSILAVPLLSAVVGLPFGIAKATSLPVVGIAALAALAAHLRGGRVRLREALPFAAGSVPAAFLAGRELSPRVPELVQTFLFAALMLVAAWRMAFRPAPDDAARARRPLPLVLLVAAATGTATGLLGVGGGFLVVPALVLTLGFDVRAAVGTSLVVVASNCAAALLADVLGPATPIRWDLAALFAATGAAGAVAGQRLGARISPLVLRRTFAVVVVCAAAALLLANVR